MTKNELMEKLRECARLAEPKPSKKGYGDPEMAHHDADNALLAFIDDPEITAAFYNIEKWYA